MAVRREKVILELDDQLSSGMVRAAASSALLDKALDRSSGSVRRFGNDSDAAGKEIDKLSGRVRIFADIAAILGPTISPLGASLVTPLVGLTNQFGFAALAGGTAVLAFQGVGDALKAMNEYGLDPSAANAEKLTETMGKLGSSSQELVRTLHDMGPEMRGLRDAAANGMFPGLIEGLDALETRLPDVQAIISTVSGTLGDLLAEGGAALASSEWDDWFATVEREARPALEDMGHSIGNITAGLAGMWEAFLPLSRDFSSGLLDMSRDFHAWADGLEGSEGFENFLQYVRESGPQAAEALGAIGNMLVQILQAAAPLGGPILAGVEAFADAVSAIADSDLGTPIFAGLAALAAFNRVAGVTRSLMGTTFGTKAKAELSGYAASWSPLIRNQNRASMSVSAFAAAEKEAAATRRSGMIKGAAGAAALVLAMSPLPEKVGMGNAAMGAMMGMLAGPWGAAVGGGVGLLMDMSAANKEVADSERRTTDAIKSGSQERIAARLAEIKAQRDAEKNSTLGKVRNALSFMGPDEGFSKDDKAAAQATRLAAAQARIRSEAASTKAALNSVYGQDVANVATMSVEQFGAAVERLNGILSGRASMRDYQAALDGVAESIKKNGRSLDITTEKGRANQAALDAVASTALRTAENMSEIDRGRYMVRARKDFIVAARDLGIGRKEARRLADQLLGLNGINARPKISLEAQAALALARQVQTAVANIRDRNIRIHTTYTQSGGAGRQMGGPSQDAFGGIHLGGVRAYAYGDIANGHMPELAGPGPTRVWREPETQGEAYIPLANDHRRPRAQAIAAETVRLLGGTAHFADGGIATYAKGGFTKAEYNRAAGNFDLKAGQSAAEAARELRAFSREVKKAGGHVGKNFGALSKRAVDVARSLEKNSAALDTLRSKQADARSGAASAFNNDAFGGTLADMKLQLEADRNDSRSLASLTANLRGKGARNDFLAEISSSKNLGLMQELSAASKSQLLSYQSLYGQRASAQGSAGAQAAAGYNAVVGQLNGLVKRQTAVLDKLEGRVQAGAKKGVQANKKATKAKGKRK